MKALPCLLLLASPLAAQDTLRAKVGDTLTVCGFRHIPAAIGVYNCQLRKVATGSPIIARGATLIVTPGRAQQVTDLKIISSTDTSLTIRWTEVNDGTGQPAKYEARISAPPITWGTAKTVSTGSCKAPITGTFIGAVRTCTIIVKP